MADVKKEDDLVHQIDASNIPNRDKIRALAVKRGRETQFFDYKDIYVRPGFNARIEYGDIESLALSLLYNGLEVPLKVDVVEENGVIKAYINEGHRRHRAFGWLIENGYEVKSVECFVNPKSTTEEDRIFTMFVTQDNKQLEPIEVAECFGRLIRLGHTPESISGRIGKSLTYVKDYIGLSKESKEIKDFVSSKQISAAAAIVLHKRVKNESERKDIIKEAVKNGRKLKVKEALATDSSSNEAVLDRIKKMSMIIGDLPDWKQAQLNTVINYLTGVTDEVTFLAYLNTNN